MLPFIFWLRAPGGCAQFLPILELSDNLQNGSELCDNRPGFPKKFNYNYPKKVLTFPLAGCIIGLQGKGKILTLEYERRGTKDD